MCISIVLDHWEASRVSLDIESFFGNIISDADQHVLLKVDIDLDSCFVFDINFASNHDMSALIIVFALLLSQFAKETNRNIASHLLALG